MTTNPRFPHWCRIYRLEGADSFNPDGEIKELYTGKCRKSSSTNIRTFNTGSNTIGKVDTADYRVSVPGIIKGLNKGDFIDVTTIVGSETAMRVVSFGASSLANGTELLCNTSSN